MPDRVSMEMTAEPVQVREQTEVSELTEERSPTAGCAPTLVERSVKEDLSTTEAWLRKAAALPKEAVRSDDPMT